MQAICKKPIKERQCDKQRDTFPNFTIFRTVSQKKNKIHHGWGLKSVRDILRDRNGEIDFYEKRNEFSVNIIIPEI